MHEPNFSKVGNMRYRRKTYEVIHRALERLLNVVSRWNHVATSHGAPSAPYQREEDHIANMVDWGERELSNSETSEIIVKGMSVESLQLQRAALELAAFLSEKETRTKSKGMPPAVADSMLVHARNYAAEASKIEQSAHPILNELLHVLGDQRDVRI